MFISVMMKTILLSHVSLPKTAFSALRKFKNDDRNRSANCFESILENIMKYTVPAD